MKQHAIEWLAPAPLWDLALEDAGNRRFREPVVLRFASDAFLDELTADLAPAPAQNGGAAAGLAARVARPETWERPATGWAAEGDGSLGPALKLYQPAHRRYYLVAANLVCRRTGLPGRKVDVAAGERASMLVRRLAPRNGAPVDPADPSTYVEQGWVGDRTAGRWEPVPADAGPLAGEERLALFALPFQDASGQPRRLHAALLPVAGREVYESAAPAGDPPEIPAAPGDDLAALDDPRKAAWASGPFLALRDLASSEPPADLTSAVARELLRFALLDLADLLIAELPELWDALVAGSRTGLDAPLAAVYDRLVQPLPWGGSWRLVLVRADDQRDVLLRGAPLPPGTTPVIPANLTLASIRPAAALLLGGLFQAHLYAAFDATPPAGPPGRGAAGAPVEAARAAAASAGEPGEEGGALYVARCVYERPRCAPYVPPVVSAPSRPCRLASFFDPDAPARPLTIRLPLDTSIKGLRRFPKSVSMLLSNKLRSQVEQVQNSKLADIDDGDVKAGDPGWTLGMICSFSIPIITLCAFIVLMIFIQLLNIVFWWLPFLKICLPIPVRSE